MASEKRENIGLRKLSGGEGLTPGGLRAGQRQQRRVEKRERKGLIRPVQMGEKGGGIRFERG